MAEASAEVSSNSSPGSIPFLPITNTASFERIHRSNLVGMGVLPLQFEEGTNAATLRLTGTEIFDVIGIEKGLQPRQKATLVVHRKDGSTERATVQVRIDTPIEVDYYEFGGILPFVLRQLVA